MRSVTFCAWCVCAIGCSGTRPDFGNVSSSDDSGVTERDASIDDDAASSTNLEADDQVDAGTSPTRETKGADAATTTDEPPNVEAGSSDHDAGSPGRTDSTQLESDASMGEEWSTSRDSSTVDASSTNDEPALVDASSTSESPASQDLSTGDAAEQTSTSEQSSVEGESSTGDETLLGDECTPGNSQTVACGLNSRGEQAQACIQGLWSVDGDCEDPDECLDEDQRTAECIDGHGAAEQSCADGRWVNDSCTLQTIYRASVSDDGDEADGASSDVSVSEDGNMVAFASDATNLVPNDTNERRDIFVRNLSENTVTLVSVNSDGGLADDRSSTPRISADGRFVAFVSDATNLIADETIAHSNIFVRDLVNGTTTLVSVAAEGGAADDFSTTPSISASGRFVAFVSHATNLVPDDTNDMPDVFLRDTLTDTISMVSGGALDAPANGGSSSPSVTEDGRYVAFSSSATNLVPGDTNGVTDVFMHSVESGATLRVHMPIPGGDTEDGNSGFPSISSDGRRVAFASSATNLVSSDTNGTQDIFVTDLVNDATIRVSLGVMGQSAGSSSSPSISADGRFVAFASTATDLVPNPVSDSRNIFVRDLENNTTAIVSLNSEGDVSDASCDSPILSADGRFVAFDSNASNLVSDDANGFRDVFVTLVPQ